MVKKIKINEYVASFLALNLMLILILLFVEITPMWDVNWENIGGMFIMINGVLIFVLLIVKGIEWLDKYVEIK